MAANFWAGTQKYFAAKLKYVMLTFLLSSHWILEKEKVKTFTAEDRSFLSPEEIVKARLYYCDGL